MYICILLSRKSFETLCEAVSTMKIKIKGGTIIITVQ